MKRFYPMALAILLFSCSDTAEKQAKPHPPELKEDSLVYEPQVDTVLTNESFSFFNNSGYTDHTKHMLNGFDWSKFRLVNVWKEDSLLVSPFEPEDDYYTRYGRFLKYSPDSSMFIDLDSYNINIRKDKNGKWIGSELGPDVEISLVNPDTRQRTRLVFLGPGGSIEEGAWIDNETLVLTGIQEMESSDTLAAIVYKYHIPSNTFFLYELEEPGKAEKLMGNWRKKRLKDVIIR